MVRNHDVGVNVNLSAGSRVLWIGAAAYPLQNIVRAQTKAFIPDRWRAIRRFLFQVVVWLALGLASMLVLGSIRPSGPGGSGVGVSGSDISGLRSLTLIVVVALIVISTIRVLVTLWSARTLYVMELQTAGSAQTALFSFETGQLSSLVRQLMDAIDNPDVEIHEHITNVDARWARNVQTGEYSTQHNA